jgi:CheY-like chemotaxis protein
MTPCRAIFFCAAEKSCMRNACHAIFCAVAPNLLEPWALRPVLAPAPYSRYPDRMRVLVIEDNNDIATNIGDYLEDRGHVVDFAGDGVTGLHLAVVNDFDTIVLDLTLPGMDGLEVCKKLRQEAKKQTPVLMLTARDALEHKLSGFDSGADDYMT